MWIRLSVHYYTNTLYLSVVWCICSDIRVDLPVGT